MIQSAAGKNRKILAAGLCSIIFFSCTAATKIPRNAYIQKKGEISMQIFSEVPVVFNPETVADGYNEKNGLIRLGNGRIVLKKTELPPCKSVVSAKLKVTLVSNGDPWDKTGSFFVIPNDSPINLISIAKDEEHYPAVDPELLEHFVGIIPAERYKPPVELLRFMTPFGVGHYGKGSPADVEKTKPVYIDSWAPCVVWEEDITDVYPLLADGAYLGVYIDTWTKEGYLVNAELNITESASDIPFNRRAEPLINTVYYLAQPIPDIFSRKSINIDFEIPHNAQNVRLKYITTGHGGHSGGDEFTPRENILMLDGKELYRFTPWKTDCASFRRFNPSAGVWLQKRTARYIGETGREEKEIEEPIASSDLSRSNWCPGSAVPPVEIPINAAAGKHTLNIAIPEAQPGYEDKYNHWLVSAYLVWEE